MESGSSSVTTVSAPVNGVDHAAGWTRATPRRRARPPGSLGRALSLAFYRWLRRERLGRDARRRLIERLADPQDDMLQALLQEGNSGLAVLDRGGVVVRAYNLLALLGGGPPEGRSLAEMLPAADREPMLARLEEARRGIEPRPLDVSLLPAGLESERAAEIGIAVVRELDGRASGFIVRLRDVTALRRLEAQLAHGQRLQAVGQLAGGVAHDFNNLLTAVLGAADEVLRLPGLAAAATADLQQIRGSAESGARLVRQLLAFSRQQTLQPVPLAVNDEIRRVSELLARSIGAQIRLIFQLAQPGPTIRMDLAQFEQVLINLVVNARDAMPGGGTLSLRSRTCRLEEGSLPMIAGGETIPGGSYVVIEVEDDGAGMPPEVLARIFEPYFSTRREQGGSGLGLSTVIGIVRQSDGFVEARSHPGRGACFCVYLPAAEPATCQPSPAPAPSVPTGPASAGQPASVRTVLLVEDEAAVRGLAERVLARRGWQVRAAGDGHDALRLISDDEPLDLLVTDAVMPGMGGPELIGRLRAGRPELPVILVSGYAEETLHTDLRRESIVFLPKPYSLAALSELMDRLVPAASAARQDAEPTSIAGPTSLVHNPF